jgi:hypothetical protein
MAGFHRGKKSTFRVGRRLPSDPDVLKPHFQFSHVPWTVRASGGAGQSRDCVDA